MNTQQNNKNFLWLAIYAILMVFVGGRWSIPVVAWLAPIFAIRFYRDSEKGGRALLWLLACLDGGIHHRRIPHHHPAFPK